MLVILTDNSGMAKIKLIDESGTIWVCQVFCVSFNKIFWGGSPPHSYIAKLLKINSLKRSL